jgi:hypothetical protein
MITLARPPSIASTRYSAVPISGPSCAPHPDRLTGDECGDPVWQPAQATEGSTDRDGLRIGTKRRRERELDQARDKPHVVFQVREKREHLAASPVDGHGTFHLGGIGGKSSASRGRTSPAQVRV